MVTLYNNRYNLLQLGKAYGVESHILGPEETKKLYPLMNVDDVYGTLYSPEDGTIDPAGYCSALTRGATRRGAKVSQLEVIFGVKLALCKSRRVATCSDQGVAYQ